MRPEELNAYWTRRFPECPPVGYLLKHLYRDRSARFRMPADGEQVPEIAQAREEVQRRHFGLLSAVFDGDQRIMLITTIPSELETPPPDVPSYLNVDPRATFLHSLGMHEFELEFDTPSFWHLFVSERENRPGEFDAILRESAGDTTATGIVNTLLLGMDSGRVLYVYPAGVDIVAESAEARDSIAAKFSAWLL